MRLMVDRLRIRRGSLIHTNQRVAVATAPSNRRSASSGQAGRRAQVPLGCDPVIGCGQSRGPIGS